MHRDFPTRVLANSRDATMAKTLLERSQMHTWRIITKDERMERTVSVSEGGARRKILSAALSVLDS